MKSDSPVVVDVRAIDVGHFSTKLTLGRKTIYDNSIPVATSIFPSLAPAVVSMPASGPLSGKPDGCVVNVGGAQYFVGKDVILHCSGREPREVLDNYSRSEKYMALIHGAFHYMFSDAGASTELVIKHLVLGLPLNTFAANRDALQKRATGEHHLPHPTLPNSFRLVTVENCTVIVQPQGALMNYGSGHRSVSEGWSIVIDAGGGTLDWFVAKGRQPNWNRSGAYPKSMLACAHAVADRINPGWRDNFEILERIDIANRQKAATFKTGGHIYEMAPYAAHIEAVLRESTDKLMARVGSLDNLDLMIFTGGGAGVYFDYFLENFPMYKHNMVIDEDPVTSNVRGFQLAGEMLSTVLNEK